MRAVLRIPPLTLAADVLRGAPDDPLIGRRSLFDDRDRVSRISFPKLFDHLLDPRPRSKNDHRRPVRRRGPQPLRAGTGVRPSSGVTMTVWLTSGIVNSCPETAAPAVADERRESPRTQSPVSGVADRSDMALKKAVSPDGGARPSSPLPSAFFITSITSSRFIAAES